MIRAALILVCFGIGATWLMGALRIAGLSTPWAIVVVLVCALVGLTLAVAVLLDSIFRF